MASEDTRPIVIKRVKKVEGGAHGGAWKLAYADFVTAMMAFFLLMWLLGSTASGDLQGIADFFKNPLKISLSGGSGVGDATSILKGGGEQLSRSSGQVMKGEVKSKSVLRERRREFERREREALERLKQRIERLIESSPTLLPFKNQLLIDLTLEGLRIQIVDERNRPMFDLASDHLKPYTEEILWRLAPLLNEMPNRLSLAGHTDAAQYAGGERGFSNWELSANRANASRRALVAGGLDSLKMLRVVGLASAVLFDPNDPLNPINRRISIIVLNKRTEAGILEEGYEFALDDDEAAEGGDDEAPVAALPSPTSP